MERAVPLVGRLHFTEAWLFIFSPHWSGPLNSSFFSLRLCVEAASDQLPTGPQRKPSKTSKREKRELLWQVCAIQSAPRTKSSQNAALWGAMSSRYVVDGI